MSDMYEIMEATSNVYIQLLIKLLLYLTSGVTQNLGIENPWTNLVWGLSPFHGFPPLPNHTLPN